MSFLIKNVAVKSFKYNSIKAKKMLIDTTKVWSGATIVSYYDGSTLLGSREIDEGLDVLHPSINTNKNGYTLVGWAKTNRGQKVTSLVAAGEKMNVYAIYLPNTLTILRASMTYSGVNPLYTVDYYNSSYMSEPVHALASGWYNGDFTTDDTQSMYISIGEYRAMTVKGIGLGWGDNIVTTIDDTNCFGAEITKTYSADRIIKMYAKGSHSDSGSWHLVRSGLTSVELSNPKPWV